jgi:hypothetical protein
MEPKRLGLLRELAPGISLVGALVNPNSPAAVRQAADIEQAARTVGQRILIANASTAPRVCRTARRRGDMAVCGARAEGGRREVGPSEASPFSSGSRSRSN